MQLCKHLVRVKSLTYVCQLLDCLELHESVHFSMKVRRDSYHAGKLHIVLTGMCMHSQLTVSVARLVLLLLLLLAG
jgi:hypothetical protein